MERFLITLSSRPKGEIFLILLVKRFLPAQPCKGEMFIARSEENSNQLR